MISRRSVIGGALTSAAFAQQQRRQRPGEWKPRLGVLGPFTEANVKFCHDEGFTNMILEGTARSTMDASTMTDEKIAAAKQILTRYNMHVSAFQASQNHISPDAAKHAQETAYFVKQIELAGKMGIPFIGTCSGKNESKPFDQQIDDIKRVYNESYFKACEAAKVRILWEPWAGGPNLATGPVGFEALFKAFGDSPYVGLQYDPSHLVWQMMDPIQTARDFFDKIYDVHLKDTQIRWDILRKTGINPPNHAEWWTFRLPGLGSMDWPGFFSVLQAAGYQGAMSIEHEDSLYGAPSRPGPDFSPEFQTGLKMAHRYLHQYVPE